MADAIVQNVLFLLSIEFESTRQGTVSVPHVQASSPRRGSIRILDKRETR